MEFRFAKSLAGHDKDEIYFVQKEESDLFYLVNGKNRTLDQAKRKKKKHTQIIKRLPDEVTEILLSGTLTDERIKRAIRIYKKDQSRSEKNEEK